MSRYFYICPGCGKASELESEETKPPVVNCGDCLMDRTEVVELKLYRAVHPIKAVRGHG